MIYKHIKWGLVLAFLYGLFFFSAIFIIQSLILYIVSFLPAAFFVPIISKCILNGFDGVNSACPSEETLFILTGSVNAIFYFFVGVFISWIREKVRARK